MGHNDDIPADDQSNINYINQSRGYPSNSNPQPHSENQPPKLEKTIPEIFFECENGEPLQLIRVKEDGQFELVEETAKKILDTDGNVGFCCLAGKYRSGKSFLLNRL